MERRVDIDSHNFRKGFLVDDEWMAGIHEVEEGKYYQAYIVNHLSGEPVAEHYFKDFNSALAALTAMDREWKFESISKCKDGSCRKIGGNCAGDRCETCACV